MSVKNFELTADLVVRSVNCPGVWLCPNGLVSLSFKTLDSKYRTDAVRPVFPLLYNTTFCFKKIFKNINSPSQVHKSLAGEIVYCELLQWPNGFKNGKGRLLATYIGVLGDLLYPPDICIGSHIDLLMKPAPIFPGILSPKIEIFKRASINEVIEKQSSRRRESVRPISISVITQNNYSVHELSDHTSESRISSYQEDQNCEYIQEEMLPKRQKPVCHSPRFHRLSPRYHFSSLSPLRREIPQTFNNDQKLIADYSVKRLHSDCSESRNSTITAHYWQKCKVCSEYSIMFGKFFESMSK